MEPGTRAKYDTLVKSVKDMGKVAVAFSGGADSTLLLKAALDSGAEVTAFMAIGEIFFPEEQSRAVHLAERMGVDLITLKVDLVNDGQFVRNWEDRCYVCKSAIFSKIKKEARELDISTILEGSHLDDLKEVRPGRAALMDLNIRSPLIDAGLNKAEVRALLKELGLPNWDQPSNTCLATRVPYDVRITSTILRRVERAEAALAPFKFKNLRVRDHEYWARVEVAPEEIPRLFQEREKVAQALKKLGYRKVALDLEGYGAR
ncbi:MAG TPA: ATP-dependent sacrificial sulfur transferase LarE [Methanomassiliicoccales archaeon]|nr:ATP-dependent sacrificial sulfur transferase LarE [Methanomassiliicoccales archaeon]